VIAWTLLSLLFVNQDKHGNTLISNKSTTQIKGTIVENPGIEYGKRNRKKLNIKLKEYPDFIFKMNL